jgi:hypothetical protein
MQSARWCREYLSARAVIEGVGMHISRRVPAEALVRILIARWQRMARSTLAAQQQHNGHSACSAAIASSAPTARRRKLN